MHLLCMHVCVSYEFVLPDALWWKCVFVMYACMCVTKLLFPDALWGNVYLLGMHVCVLQNGCPRKHCTSVMYACLC